MQEQKALYLAVDVGASSGRHILGRVENGRIVLKEIYRFETPRCCKDGHDCWDLDALWEHVLAGLEACRAAGMIPDAMGIDTWGVDFVLLGDNGRLLGDAVAYRDRRTEGMEEAVDALLGPAALYTRTGIQRQRFNTLYQLAALKKEHPEQLAAARRFLMIPDYLHYRLTGVCRNEYTNATTTGLVNTHTKTWDAALLNTLGLPEAIFGAPALPGTRLGTFTKDVRERVGFGCEVLLPATHDTGSAFLAVPARECERCAYLSSGTWSLLGTERKAPIVTEESRRLNFTNEGGYGYRFRFLKNIMGLWMVQSIRRELNAGGRRFSFAQLEDAARAADGFDSVVDANAAAFLAPDSMAGAVREACRKTGQRVPETPGELVRCVYRSLAACYAQGVQQLGELAGEPISAVRIVGGGSKDGYLNELTARAAGLPVFAGPVEATVLGNLMVQMLAHGEFPDLAAARCAVRESFSIQEVSA